MAREVERKFVVEGGLPDGVEAGTGSELQQGYLAGEGEVEVRLRLADGAATLTVKGGSGLSRVEVELAVPAPEADELWALTAGRRVEKVRHRIPLGESGLVAELDVYGGALAGLCTVEVEFTSEEEAGAFEPLAWFGREVTGEEGWRNADLARHGVP